ncbi:EamA family transporter [Methylobacterium mesophilicum]|uniref:EamA family transporter n=1 Tax=Methylobacterium TaxID=407 RepID=UPI0011C80EB5|nr:MULTISPECIES: EamA family transporter [Methylobacterium]TXN43444.1 EamA family transporter [Methylobacterium sp. WL7]GJE24002.1 putative amino-acid metabolite efflux pump [Methylobacterium mesophilicum]
METATLPLRDLCLAVAVVAVWGTNFVVIRIGLDHLPPLLFAALRFTLAACPGVFLMPRPNVTWRNLAAYGLLIGAGQFGLLFIAMRGHITPGLASLVIQVQVFFTIGLSIWITGERVLGYQWAALALAAAGIGVIALHADGATTPFGLGLIVLAAASWAGGNIAAKRSGVRAMLPYVVWASLFSAPPLFALSFLLEGWDAIRAGLQNADAATWGAVIWQTVGNTLFGYAVWGWLLSRHPAARIVPIALLVPVFGMAGSAVWLGETLPGWKLGAAGLVLGGLALGILYPRWQARLA